MKGKQAGFTLIELVVVIVILGILAVTALPKFLNLQGNAREASLQGLKGAIDGAAVIVYGKAAIEGLETSATGTTTDGITVVYGYPSTLTTGIEDSVTGLDTDWTAFVDGTAGSDPLLITFNSSSLTDAAGITATNCYITYTPATSASSAYSVVVTPGGC
ncbi:prepilin-type N-terminal cleavage/methylation domain-containing protein [Vibrio profundum]|uniref:type II secretion system protein n=1 Tax=Vibrio profundum TaxID=2910247 RepID=UPI003D0BAF1E